MVALQKMVTVFAWLKKPVAAAVTLTWMGELSVPTLMSRSVNRPAASV